METDEQVKSMAQEIANTLVEAAYFVRVDPFDAQNSVGSIEAALTKLRALVDRSA